MSSSRPHENTIPAPPEKPDPSECCGSGCVPCIYDYYFDRLALWEEQWGAAWKAKVELKNS